MTDATAGEFDARPGQLLSRDTEQRRGAACRAKRKRVASAEATQIGDSVPSRFRVELVEEWDEPDYVSVKCRDPDGYIVEAA